MATKTSSSRAASPAAKTLRALARSRTAGVVAAVVGAAVTTAVGAALVKKSRASSGKKTAATAKKRSTTKARASRRVRKTKAPTAGARR